MVKIKGSEKFLHGYSAVPVFIVPGAIGAKADIALPDDFKGAQDLVQLIKVLVSDGTATGAVAEYEIDAFGTAAPATGHAALYDEDNIRIGDATTALDVLLVILKFKSFEKNL